MKIKLIVIGAVIVFLYLAKRKKDSAKQEKKLEAALKANEMPAGEQLDIIRLKIEDFLKGNFPFMSDDERTYWVLDITSNLETYKQKYLSPAK